MPDNPPIQLPLFNWYATINVLTKKLANKYKLTPEQIAGIITSFSGQTKWKDNIQQTIAFLKGTELKGMYSKAQVKAAERIRDGEDPMAVWGKTSYKYHNFYASIKDPEDKNAVCVDTHMIRWYKGYFPSTVLKTVPHEKIFRSKRYYSIIQRSIKVEAKKRGLVPSHYQSIIWIGQRGGKVF